MIKRIAAVSAGDIDSTKIEYGIDSTTVVYGELLSFSNPDSLILEFDRDFNIQGNRADSVVLVVDILDQAEATDFRIRVDSLNIVEIVDTFEYPLAVLNQTSANFYSQWAILVDGNLANSFYNYPNPFNSTSSTTSFLYYLKEESDVKIHIYTLTGELVKTWEKTKANDPEGTFTRVGLHQGNIIWDGKNGVGEPVVNGVYLAYIGTDYGEQAVTKIVVVR